MHKVKKNTLYFFIGATLYPIIELLYRGYTHLSMAFAGGICVVLINKICCEILKTKNLITKAISGGMIITAVEFIIGIFLNLILKLKVWDYSNSPYNLLGQICLPFTLIWTIISIPVIYFCKWFNGIINNKKQEREISI